MLAVPVHPSTVTGALHNGGSGYNGILCILDGGGGVTFFTCYAPDAHFVSLLEQTEGSKNHCSDGSNKATHHCCLTSNNKTWKMTGQAMKTSLRAIVWRAATSDTVQQKVPKFWCLFIVRPHVHPPHLLSRFTDTYSTLTHIWCMALLLDAFYFISITRQLPNLQLNYMLHMTFNSFCPSPPS